ncbi:hypothetical protein O181_086857 [Austropuccinia psidii MF-1]|uniref:CCHC-type domain-containing protein n=1 Tax=Austropuccinia psidii MF-1 TaxID=1389203 RepID=A0A9Q3INL1_9BASI|nr:hypothetical protein [Austropuccinia psidii MF-1]
MHHNAKPISVQGNDGQIRHQNLCSRPPTFASCVLTPESCFHRPDLNNVKPFFNPIIIQQQPLSVTKEDKHSAMRAMFQITCHNCNKCRHMAKSCPEGKLGKGNTSTPPLGMRPTLAPANFQAHYPIITPPKRFPFHNFNNTQHPASKLTKQPDFYHL